MLRLLRLTPTASSQLNEARPDSGSTPSALSHSRPSLQASARIAIGSMWRGLSRETQRRKRSAWSFPHRPRDVEPALQALPTAMHRAADEMTVEKRDAQVVTNRSF